jgi:D-sedoheptulose 7-phosphate isomerase
MLKMSFENYLNDFITLAQSVDKAEVQRLNEAIAAAYNAGKRVFIIGNGGSAANASHLCEDLGKGTLSDFENQKRLKVISLTDNAPYILAWGNDTSFDRVFVEQLKNLAENGDLLIAISGSGNSPNIVRAVEYANENGLKTFAITGYDGGKLLKCAQDALWIRSHNMGMVEVAHDVVFHYLTEDLMKQFAGATK